MKRLLLGLLLSLAMIAALTFAARPALADYGPGHFSAFLNGSVSVYSDPGSELADGVETTLPTAFAGVSGYPNSLDVDFSPPGSQTSWDLDFGAPSGETLTSGTVYDGAMGSPDSSTPYMMAINGSESCTGDGRFEVKDIAYDASGTPTRLWIVYELHCGGPAALFGEIRLGEPAASGSLGASPTLVRWPADNLGTAETPVPVLFTAAQATTVDTVELGGDQPQNFRISQDNCTGQDLGSGDSCTVWVDLDPLAAGTTEASLQLSTTDGQTTTVPLQGFTYGGTTRLTLNSDPGDDLLKGQGHTVGVAGNVFNAWGTPREIHFGAITASHTFAGQFDPPSGATLTPGSSWTQVVTAPGNGSSPGAELDVDSYSCGPTDGQFEVISATYDSHNELTSADIQFRLLCSGATGDVHGELQWRADDSVAPAPWMEADATGASTVTAGGSAPSGSGAGSPTSPTAPSATVPTVASATASPAATDGPASSPSTPSTTGPASTNAPRGVSSPSVANAQIKRLGAMLSRDSRRVQRATPRHGDRSSLQRARRAIATLQTAVTNATHRLQTLGQPDRGAVRRALVRLANWQKTLTAERRLLASAHGALPSGLLGVVARADRQGTAGTQALLALITG
jgi:hypothetical protein